MGRAVGGSQAIGLIVSAGRIGAQEEAAPAPEAVSGAALVLAGQQASFDGPVRVSAEVKRSGGGGLVPGGVTVRAAPGLAEGAVGNVSRHHPGDAVTRTVIDPNGKPVASFEAKVTTERGHVQLHPSRGTDRFLVTGRGGAV